ncbi:MAG: hypothetical protein JWN63_1851, partial [Candidatus Acidoferrum typicum]|nr:hypothetical protein [Candidatus Acidoferrum typicum]
MKLRIRFLLFPAVLLAFTTAAFSR